jgi:hypothetical protein
MNFEFWYDSWAYPIIFGKSWLFMNVADTDWNQICMVFAWIGDLNTTIKSEIAKKNLSALSMESVNYDFPFPKYQKAL